MRILAPSVVFGLLCFAGAAECLGAEEKSEDPNSLHYVRSESSGVELIVCPFFLTDTLGTRDANGHVPLVLRIQISLRNKTDKPISLVTSEKWGFRERLRLGDDEIMFAFNPGNWGEARPPGVARLRAKPSELDLVTLQSNEAVLMQELQISTTSGFLSNRTLKITYEIGRSATDLYGVWSGKISVPIKFGSLSGVAAPQPAKQK